MKMLSVHDVIARMIETSKNVHLVARIDRQAVLDDTGHIRKVLDQLDPHAFDTLKGDRILIVEDDAPAAGFSALRAVHDSIDHAARADHVVVRLSLNQPASSSQDIRKGLDKAFDDARHGDIMIVSSASGTGRSIPNVAPRPQPIDVGNAEILQVISEPRPRPDLNEALHILTGSFARPTISISAEVMDNLTITRARRACRELGLSEDATGISATSRSRAYSEAAVLIMRAEAELSIKPKGQIGTRLKAIESAIAARETTW